MSADQAWRIAALCLLLASAEMLHGIARTVLVAPRLGKELATKLSIVSGSLLALAICAWWVPGIGLRGVMPHLALGLGLALFMASFDIAIGRFVMRMKWPRILRDFNPAHGNYLLFGLIFLVFLPVLVMALRPGGAGP